MAILGLIAGLVAIFGGALAGWLLGGRQARLWRWAAAVDLACLGAWFATHQYSDWSLRHIAWRDYVYFDRTAMYAAVFLLLGLCLRQIPRRTSRALLGTLAAIFATYGLVETGSSVFFSSSIEALDRRTTGAEVGQTAGWSCGPAALAWAAREKGLPASEYEMARFAAANPLRGTKLAGARRALQLAGRDLGWRVEARKGLSWDELLREPPPFVVGWRMMRIVDHMVAVLAIEPQRALVADPLGGKSWYSREEFMKAWSGDAVWVEE